MIIIKYPKNYFEAKKFLFTLSQQLDEIRALPKSYIKSKKLLLLLQIIYTTLEYLDNAINKSEDKKELKRLNAARYVLERWLKRNNFEGKKSGKTGK